MPKTTKPMSKTTTTRTTSRKPTAKAPRLLDEETSAHVVAEYLAIENVETKEIDQVLDGPRPDGLSHREIALTFRISEQLDMPPAFAIAPRYRLAFDRAQEYLKMLGAAVVASAATPAGSLACTEAR